MNKKFMYYAAFFLMLVFAFLYGLRRAIPGFGDVRLPVMTYVKPFSFTDQNGNHVSQKDVDGKVYVAEYFFTTCKGICPKMNGNMKKLFAEFKGEKGFMIMSHTVDPDVDSIGRLRRYADSLQVNTGQWRFLTGRKDSLYTAARVSYLLDDPKNNSDKIENQFIHTQFFALVDKAGRVRKIYDGLKNDEIKELGKDIRALLEEPAGSNPL